MGFTIHQEQAKVRAVWRFQVHAELRDVRLLDCSASIAETGLESDGQLLLGFHLESSVMSSPEGSARFGVRIIVHGDPKDEEGKPATHLFEVACRCAVEYALKEGYTPSQEDLDAFKDANAVFHCWPYFRELVQNLAMRMGLQIPPMPLLRLAPKPVLEKGAAKRSSKKQQPAEAGQPDPKS